MDDYPIKRWHYIAAFLLLLATGIVPAEPEPEPTDNQYWAETHYERDYALNTQLSRIGEQHEYHDYDSGRVRNRQDN